MKKQNLFYLHFLFAKLSLANNHTRYYQLSRVFMGIFGVFLAGCSGLFGQEADPMLPAPTEFAFEQYEIATGAAKHQTVLTGFLFGDTTAELVVANIDEEDDRRLQIYAFDDGSWALRLEAALHPEVLFVDVANIGGRDRLITYENGRLNWFDPESATGHPLAAVTSNTPPPIGEIPHLDVTHDLNDDNRDDLVVPDFDGFWVFIQMGRWHVRRSSEDWSLY